MSTSHKSAASTVGTMVSGLQGQTQFTGPAQSGGAAESGSDRGTWKKNYIEKFRVAGTK